MNIWKFSIVFVSVAIVHLAKINADEEAASVATATEGVSSSVYAQNDAASYADAYAQYYAQYLPEITANERNYYQDYLRNAQKYSHKTLRKQDYATMMKDALGEEAAITLGLIGALTGVISLIGLVVNAQSISSLSTDQDSICTTAKSLGGFTCTKSATPTVAELGACFDTLVGYSTPSC